MRMVKDLEDKPYKKQLISLDLFSLEKRTLMGELIEVTTWLGVGPNDPDGSQLSLFFDYMKTMQHITTEISRDITLEIPSINTETLDALPVTPKPVLGDQEDIPILAGLSRKGKGEKNTSKEIDSLASQEFKAKGKVIWLHPNTSVSSQAEVLHNSRNSGSGKRKRRMEYEKEKTMEK
ncbi:hypothetical protein BTVI_125698 [Pitangus sulphuratus]|nr:hypothetical protein BTVI_125698 [Pitangus sulphuratus]